MKRTRTGFVLPRFPPQTCLLDFAGSHACHHYLPVLGSPSCRYSSFLCSALQQPGCQFYSSVIWFGLAAWFCRFMVGFSPLHHPAPHAIWFLFTTWFAFACLPVVLPAVRRFGSATHLRYFCVLPPRAPHCLVYINTLVLSVTAPFILRATPHTRFWFLHTCLVRSLVRATLLTLDAESIHVRARCMHYPTPLPATFTITCRMLHLPPLGFCDIFTRHAAAFMGLLHQLFAAPHCAAEKHWLNYYLPATCAPVGLFCLATAPHLFTPVCTPRLVRCLQFTRHLAVTYLPAAQFAVHWFIRFLPCGFGWFPPQVTTTFGFKRLLVAAALSAVVLHIRGWVLPYRFTRVHATLPRSTTFTTYVR